jgi:hypothetical protein
VPKVCANTEVSVLTRQRQQSGAWSTQRETLQKCTPRRVVNGGSEGEPRLSLSTLFGFRLPFWGLPVGLVDAKFRNTYHHVMKYVTEPT